MAEETNLPEADTSEAETSAQETAQPAKVTVGMSLQAMREYKKFNLEDIAAETQISKEKLDNIEKMNFDQPSVYLRGAVKTYAAMLGLPADAYETLQRPRLLLSSAMPARKKPRQFKSRCRCLAAPSRRFAA